MNDEPAHFMKGVRHENPSSTHGFTVILFAVPAASSRDGFTVLVGGLIRVSHPPHAHPTLVDCKT